MDEESESSVEEEDLCKDLVEVAVDVGEPVVDASLDSCAEVAIVEDSPVWEGPRPVVPLAAIVAAGC